MNTLDADYCLLVVLVMKNTNSSNSSYLIDSIHSLKSQRSMIATINQIAHFLLLWRKWECSKNLVV